MQSLIRDGQLSRIARMIERRPALLNVENEAGCPVYWATIYSRYDVLKWLLDHGAKAGHTIGHKKKSALHYACDIGNLRMMSLLIEKGADPLATNPPILSTAVKNGYMHLVTYLLNKLGPEIINARHKDGSGWTALHSAAATGQCQSIELLLAYGADPTLCDKEGKTPLDTAQEKIEKKGGGCCDSMEKKCLMLLQDAMMEPERISLLHKARAISDLHHTMNQVATHENIIIPPTTSTTSATYEQEKKLHCLHFTPAYLKNRVEEEQILPNLEMRSGGEEEESEEEEPSSIFHFQHCDSDSSLSSSASSSSSSSSSETASFSSSPSSSSFSSSPTSSSHYFRTRRNSRSGSICMEDDPYVLQTRRAVFEHVATGGLIKELMVELTEMMLPDWAPSRKMMMEGGVEGQEVAETEAAVVVGGVVEG